MEINAAQIYATLVRRFDRSDPDDIHDAVAESHSAVWMARESGAIIHNVDAFCTVVAKRALSRQVNRQRRHVYPDRDPFLNWNHVEGGQDTTVVEQPDSTIDTQEILEQAPENYAEVLRLHYLEGLPLEEAAKKIGVSGPCIRKRHERALKWARRHFTDRDPWQT